MAVKRRHRGPAAREGEGPHAAARSVDLLWGSRQRPLRGPKPALTLDAIVAAALRVVDAEGLAALTMARIAGELDVTTMALYRYVPGKDELIDLMIDASLGTPAPATGRGWRAELEQWVREDLAIFRRHPWLLENATNRVPIGPNWLAWLESALRALSGIGLTGREMIAMVFLIDGHARSTAAIELGVASTPQWAADFGRVLQSAVGSGRFSALAHVAATGGFAGPAAGEQSHFEFGLQRLLDGIETFIASRAVSGRRERASKRARHTRGRQR